MYLLPAVLFTALRRYKFDESPLWRMADGKDHVKVEVTFRKTTHQRYDKKGAESRRRPTPPAGECPRQPAQARQPTASRQTPARRSPPYLERKTPPPPTQTLQQQPETITLPRYKTTTTITASPTIYRPAPTSSPDAPLKKKSRTASPTRDFFEPPTR